MMGLKVAITGLFFWIVFAAWATALERDLKASPVLECCVNIVSTLGLLAIPVGLVLWIWL